MELHKSDMTASPSVKIAYGAILIALAVALGYALALVPNIELVTLTLAFGGFLLGGWWGMLVGALGFGLYSVLSPFGVAPPPLLFAQIIGGAFIGLGGSFLRKIRRRNWLFYAASGATGFIITLFYDISTNVGSFIMISSESTLLPFIIGGLSFSIMHIVANTAIFAILFPILSRYINISKR